MNPFQNGFSQLTLHKSRKAGRVSFETSYMHKFYRCYFIFLSLSVVLIVAANIVLPDNNLHIVFCDVGQGDGILIYQKDKQVVVDGGPNDAMLSCMSRYLPFWDRSIELVILTNPDTDHYTGLVGVLKNYKVENYIAPQLSKDDAGFKQLATEIEKESKNGMRVYYGFAGQKVVLASQGVALRGWEMEDVWPTREFFAEKTSSVIASGATPKAGGAKQSMEEIATSSRLGRTPRDDEKILAATSGKKTNELSLVYLLKFGNFKALLTGDIEPPASDEVVRELKEVVGGLKDGKEGVTVLKVPHHGSKNGLTEELLRAVNPQLAIISAGRNNRFGHPSPETLNLLKGVQTLRTDEKGNIEVVTDGKKWWVRY